MAISNSRYFQKAQNKKVSNYGVFVFLALKRNELQKQARFELFRLSLNEMLAALKNNLSSADHKDDIVVFSPGATSFGMFTNEFDRGNKYMAAVKELVK